MFQSDSNSAYMHLVGRAAGDRPGKDGRVVHAAHRTVPKGLEDPALTLIDSMQTTASLGQPGRMLQVLAAFTKAVVTGKPGQGGEAGDLEL
jgi:hypothetical protein